MSDDKTASAASDSTAPRILRHTLIDRLFHWLSAIAVIVLLATSLLPVLGVKFDWITIHWVAGLVLAIAILLHILQTVIAGRIREMWFGLDDLRQTRATLAWLSKLSDSEPSRPGKYSPAQKLVHLFFAVLVLTAIATGILMMVRIDTPIWERDPYLLEASVWGVIYVLHGLSTLFLITVIILHIYFALRPEKLHYLRSMVKGWITKDEFVEHHDPSRWNQSEK